MPLSVPLAPSQALLTKELTRRQNQLHGFFVIFQVLFGGQLLSFLGVLPFPVVGVAAPVTVQWHEEAQQHPHLTETTHVTSTKVGHPPATEKEAIWGRQTACWHILW